ncbi:MAG: type III toxin-antitoxin system ToxN/AbiQ family toxin [Eubacteriales bacterium]|nr:type III toxin-antitoxin system ToxN/AbiQ family toxin [Eubacteriales bacterium]
MEKRFNLYWIDMKYIRNLQNADKRVYSVNPQQGKQSRPYLGIIVVCNNQKYCIPLTTPKDKHFNMTDKIDFSRIDIDGKFIAAINFSRMIPVEMNQLSRADIKIRKHDNKNVIDRKELLKKELDWCNENYDVIVNKANVLYAKYLSGENFRRKKDCLDFIELEKVCSRYNCS